MADLSHRMLELFETSHGPVHPRAWGVQLRRRFGYFTPDEYYEELLDRLIECQSVWLDVGGGTTIFPGNATLSKILSDRCEHLTVVDPSANIEDNPYAHERIRGMLEDIPDIPRFTLATARMVAEHVDDPMGFGRETGPGGAPWREGGDLHGQSLVARDRPVRRDPNCGSSLGEADSLENA